MTNEKKQEWNEARMLVLSELEALKEGMNDIKSDTSEIKESLVAVKSSQKGQWLKINELNDWKEETIKILSVPQMDDLVKDVKDLKTFKTKAITIWAFAYLLAGVGLALLEIYHK